MKEWILLSNIILLELERYDLNWGAMDICGMIKSRLMQIFLKNHSVRYAVLNIQTSANLD